MVPGYRPQRRRTFWEKHPRLRGILVSFLLLILAFVGLVVADFVLVSSEPIRRCCRASPTITRSRSRASFALHGASSSPRLVEAADRTVLPPDKQPALVAKAVVAAREPTFFTRRRAGRCRHVARDQRADSRRAQRAALERRFGASLAARRRGPGRPPRSLVRGASHGAGPLARGHLGRLSQRGAVRRRSLRNRGGRACDVRPLSRCARRQAGAGAGREGRPRRRAAADTSQAHRRARLWQSRRRRAVGALRRGGARTHGAGAGHHRLRPRAQQGRRGDRREARSLAHRPQCRGRRPAGCPGHEISALVGDPSHLASRSATYAFR